jgi:hypothetical protein
MRKALFCILLLLVGLIFSMNSGQPMFEPVVKAFNESGISFKEAGVNAWARVEDKGLDSSSEMKAVVWSISQDLGVAEGKAETVQEGKIEKVVLRGAFPGGGALSAAEICCSFEQGSGEYAVTLDISQISGRENIIDIGERVRGCISKYSSDNSVNMHMTGYEKGMLAQSERSRVISSMLADMNAHITQSIDDGSLISVCGYSGSIPFYIRCGSVKMNINAASRYSSYDDRTYFWVGTPIINIEY